MGTRGRTPADDLMRYLDGELPPREAREVERHIAADPDAQKQLEALRELGDVVRARTDIALAEATPRLENLWARIEHQLEPAFQRREAPAREKRGIFAALSDWMQGFRGYALTGALCAAAGALLVWMARGETIVEKPVVQYVEVTAPQPPIAPAVVQAAEVERLEVQGGTGTIMRVAGEAEGDPAHTVIWITRDEDRGPEGPI